MDTEKIKELAQRIRANIGRVLVGKEAVTDLLIVALLCRGHVLVEDVPGTGKTMLAKSLAKSVDASFCRVQFTPDLLPSDITGINFFNLKHSEFEFMPGPVFANFVLADEINRATPKTQSGLLESMEEHQVTIDGQTRVLQEPFMVIATQNPVETQGTFPLPEAQLDRFLLKINMKYPTRAEGKAILERFLHDEPFDTLQTAVTKDEILEAQRDVKAVFVHPVLMEYIVTIVEETRRHDNVDLGVSPRGCLSLMKAAQAFAAIQGRSFVLPDDIKAVSLSVLRHRLILKSMARLEEGAETEIVEEILNRVPVPTEDFRS